MSVHGVRRLTKEGVTLGTACLHFSPPSGQVVCRPWRHPAGSCYSSEMLGLGPVYKSENDEVKYSEANTSPNLR